MGGQRMFVLLLGVLALLGLGHALVLNMKTVVVFGGSGQTGREVVYQALGLGCRVVTLARTPSKLTFPDRVKGQGVPLVDPKLTVIQGDVCNAADVEKCFAAAQDEVVGAVVALGGKTKDVGPTMLTDGTTNIISSMQKQGRGKRLAVVTSIGTGDSEKQAPMMFRALMYTVMKNIFTDKNNQERLFTSADGPGSGLEYCIVRPGGLGVGEPTGVVNVIDGEAGSIQRADVASFCLGAVLDADFGYLRKTPCISSSLGVSWKKQPEIAGFDKVKTLD
jgi:nucleoside-diphosphate-sugar epimerase